MGSQMSRREASAPQANRSEFRSSNLLQVNWGGIKMHRIQHETAISRGMTRYLATILLLGAAVGLAAAPAHAAKVTRYLIVSGDSSSGSWDSHEQPRLEEWRAKYGSHFAWFRQDGRDYIVTDSRVLAQVEAAMAPQREVNRQQSEVNRHQSEVNRPQDGVNSHQADVNRAQAEVNRQQNLANRREVEQSRVNQLQSEVNGKQHAVNAEQDKVNQRQATVNKEQGEVNQNQTLASAEIDKALQAIFDTARAEGSAHEAR